MTYVGLAGCGVAIGQLSIRRAIALGSYVGRDHNHWVSLVGAIQGDGWEAILLDVQVQVPTRPRYDIKPVERVATLFAMDDAIHPEILPLRADFPVVPHMNYSLLCAGRSLCLHDEPWSSVKLTWTPANQIEAVRNWLQQTAIGALHQEDQPLEPLLFVGTDKLVLPSAIFENGEVEVHQLRVRAVQDSLGRATYVADVPDGPQGGVSAVALTITCPPQTHGVILSPPSDLRTLHGLLSSSGYDLLSKLRDEFRSWFDSDHEWLRDHRESPFILVVRLPKTRVAEGPIEATEVRAFFAVGGIGAMGTDIGVWEVRGGHTVPLLARDLSRQGENTAVSVLDAMPALSRDAAAKMNSQQGNLSCNVVAIGAGALGSQIYLNAVRSGFGVWTLIDHDLLLPHNVARHALPGVFIGYSKAVALASIGAGILGDSEASKAIVSDVLDPRGKACEIAAAIHESDVIVDMSASIPVARHLAVDVSLGGRRMSIFLNPKGDSVTVLAEDKDRGVKLDALEMQFYRLLLREPRLSGYMADTTGRIRPGLSCRDVTSTIPQDMVAILSGIAGRAVKRLTMKDAAAIAVWTVEDSSLGVQFVEAAPQRTIIRRVGGWTVVTDEGLVQQMDACREASLPNETGGVLLGQYDMSRRIIYVFDMLPAPADSERWPTAYIRGSEGLLARVKEARKLSGDMADYVGEWHSHPKGISTSASPDDVNVLRWVSVQKARDGHPGLVMIVGDDRRVNIRVLDQPLRVA